MTHFLEGVVVTAGQLGTVDVTLEVGAISEAVAVIADAPMISAHSAVIGHTLDASRSTASPPPWQLLHRRGR